MKQPVGRIKALLAALKDVDIDEALKSAAMPMAVAAAPGAAAETAPAAEEKKEEEEEKEEEDVAGLGSLFG